MFHVLLLTVLRKSRWGCQNHPLARIATSLEGLIGDVEISGHISSMFEANRELVFPTRLKGTKADEMNNCVKKMTRVRVLGNIMATIPTFEDDGDYYGSRAVAYFICSCFMNDTIPYHNTQTCYAACCLGLLEPPVEWFPWWNGIKPNGAKQKRDVALCPSNQ